MSIPTLQIRKDDEHKFTVRATWPDGAFEEMAGRRHQLRNDR